MDLSPVMSIKETAEYLRSSRGHVYNLIRRGKLTAIKVGGRTLIRKTEIAALLAAAPTLTLKSTKTFHAK
ncbi:MULTISPECIES: helix-turn-helix domain-containing protein [unclassified Shinella]|uniref:helix-turn-helix domain-containing protein n=1 Tax=unclassified Shinella TaxID=2643062 RepID=UPI00225D0D40|nr:hypothetical protein SHINE37_44670 [Rhizobiaceae bacterium]CAK7259146.1 protein of unknown function [Shinella sp. WSC3-e]